MEPSTPPKRRNPAPLGLLGMLALVALAEHRLRDGEGRYLDPGGWDFLVTGRSATREVAARDLLIFGDSLIKLAAIPGVIERESGARAYNLAVSGSQTPVSYALLRSALASGARPRAILLEAAPSLLRAQPGDQAGNWSRLLGYADSAQLAWTSRDPDLFGRLVSGRTLVSVRNRHGIRESFLGALIGSAPAFSETTVRAQVRNWADNAGAQVMPNNPALRDYPLDVEGWCRDFYPRWECHPANIAYLRRFLDLAASRKITVFWVLTPILPAVQAHCDRSGFSETQTRFLQALSRRYPNLIVVDGRHAGYEEGVFMDPNHLGRDGAYSFSVELGRLLRESDPASLRGSRWLTLPAYSARVADASVRDVRQTEAELASPAGPLRR